MYGLELGDRFEIKRIAGKSLNVRAYRNMNIDFCSGRIVPAIGTTTATVSGLVHLIYFSHMSSVRI